MTAAHPSSSTRRIGYSRSRQRLLHATPIVTSTAAIAAAAPPFQTWSLIMSHCCGVSELAPETTYHGPCAAGGAVRRVTSDSAYIPANAAGRLESAPTTTIHRD